ncbi:DUF5677 domain-containing protein [Lysinibacillus xylanilyticus]|uniref:DUF5677 domain-containing protein n=1 Tax=Lysinibacillus xylanilyticus TaxID=582475 RepID=UPI00382578D1
MNTDLNLFNYLYLDDVRGKIIKENRELLEESTKLMAYIENDFLVLLNEISLENTNEFRVNQAVFILFAQGVKSAKSSLVLCLEGYFTNSVMCLRNCLETIFNIKYIIGDRNKSLNRAEKYLTKPGYWADDSVKKRANMELDNPLYEVYSVFSNYTHSNYMGASQNISSEESSSTFSISTLPSTEKCSNLINILNALLYFLINVISEYYNVDNPKFNSIQLNEKTKELLDMFNTERQVIMQHFKEEMGLPIEDIEEIIKEYKKSKQK